MLKRITDDKQRPLTQVLTKIKTTYFRAPFEKKKGKWIYLAKQSYSTR